MYNAFVYNSDGLFTESSISSYCRLNQRRVGGVGGDVGCRTRYANMAAIGEGLRSVSNDQ